MHDRGDFLTAIRATPDDRTPRLVFADFLAESGDPDDAREAVAWRESCDPQTRYAQPGESPDGGDPTHWNAYRAEDGRERWVGHFPTEWEAVEGFVRWWLNGKGVWCSACDGSGADEPRFVGTSTPGGEPIDYDCQPCHQCDGKGWRPRCDHDGCDRSGDPVFLPGEDAPDGHYCHEHARGAGFCPSCGSFWAGVESFDLSRTGLCEHCASEADEDDHGETDEWDEFLDEMDPESLLD